MSPRSMATFMEASMANGAPAETALVNPHVDQQAQAVDGPHGLQGHRLLQPERRRSRPEVVVRGVEVAVDHARHHGSARAVDHPVVRAGSPGTGRGPRR